MEKEIGGYFEMEYLCGNPYHEEAISLNCGRGCLEYLIELRRIRNIWIPDLICEAVINCLQKNNIKIKTYSIGDGFQPIYNFEMNPDEWIYLVDYYGQLQIDDVENAMLKSDGKVIIDETHGFFTKWEKKVDTFYSCRKWFGVPDGGYLSTAYSDKLERDIEQGYSFDRMRHILGRLEKNASEFYVDSRKNEDYFDNVTVMKMSLSTENIMRSIDYERVIKLRKSNWNALRLRLDEINLLCVKEPYVPFMYPLMLKDAQKIRKCLIEKKIYIPVFWANVFEGGNSNSVANTYAHDILPLPVDQRYNGRDMNYIIDSILELV